MGMLKQECLSVSYSCSSSFLNLKSLTGEQGMQGMYHFILL